MFMFTGKINCGIIFFKENSARRRQNFIRDRLENRVHPAAFSIFLLESGERNDILYILSGFPELRRSSGQKEYGLNQLRKTDYERGKRMEEFCAGTAAGMQGGTGTGIVGLPEK